jgi:hypothetical protein
MTGIENPKAHFSNINDVVKIARTEMKMLWVCGALRGWAEATVLQANTFKSLLPSTARKKPNVIFYQLRALVYACDMNIRMPVRL